MAKLHKNKKDDWLIKAYDNSDFLNSPPARTIRILAEMIEPATRLHKHHIRDTVVFFGSARIKSHTATLKELKRLEAQAKGKHKSPNLLRQINKIRKYLTVSRYYDDAAKLSEKLTLWFAEPQFQYRQFLICSGGGPGIMEAANLGAQKAGGRSIGLNISLPMEQTPNPYQTKDISFEFHYFFIRKFWFFYLAKALVVFPGGFGTLDEFFELLTIVQTRKTKKDMPIILYGSEYWNKVINFKTMADWGMISPSDLKLFHVVDSVDEAYELLKKELNKRYFTKNV